MPYTAIMDNGPAKKEGFGAKLQNTGENFGDMFEVSSIRSEDFDNIKDKSGEFVDILNCQSHRGVPRGHQWPAAFMIRVKY